MRTCKRTLIVMMLSAMLACGAQAGEDSQDVEELTETVEAQERRIQRLETKLRWLEDHVTTLADEADVKLRDGGQDRKGKEDGDDEQEDDDEKKEEGASLSRLDTSMDKWVERHYVDYGWKDKKGWNVLQGQEKKAHKLVADQGKKARIRHKTLIEGRFTLRATLMARDNAQLELVHESEDQPYKKGFSIDLPEGEPARIVVAREDGAISATINGQDGAVVEKHYGGAMDDPVYVALTIPKGHECLLRSIMVKARQ